MDFTGASIISPVEAELAIRELQPIPLSEMASEKWKAQRVAVERLNMCTHSNAVKKVDDCVKSFLVEHEKLPVLLHELLSAEVYRQRVLPNIMEAVATNPTAPYLYCNYESILVNLLECVCFYEEVITGFGDDILELIDYCWRQIYRLFSDPKVNQVQPILSAEEMKNETPLQHLEKQLYSSQITRAMSCISILWFIIDRLDDLPMSAMNAILIKNDLPVGLSEVLLLQPWIRRSATSQQKYKNSEFVDAPGDEMMRVCTPEAHTWFCLHHLLCNRDCRTKYTYTQHKKESILRIRRFLNETLVDQIPALQSVQRALEELSFLEPPSGTEEKFRSSLIIEQTGKKDQERLQRILRDPAEMSRDAMRLSSLFDDMFGKGE
eukprot:gene8372-5861_t